MVRYFLVLSLPWNHSRPGWMGLWATWSRGRCLCRVLELDDLKGPFQPKPFYESMILWCYVAECSHLQSWPVNQSRSLRLDLHACYLPQSRTSHIFVNKFPPWNKTAASKLPMEEVSSLHFGLLGKICGIQKIKQEQLPQSHCGGPTLLT